MAHRKPKCVICGLRPANGNGKGQCHNCAAKVDKDKRLKAKRNGKGKPERFLTYKGNVVGLYREAGKVWGKLVLLNPDTLPKAKVTDLNSWVEGASREEVKRLKASVLRLANTMER